jgi:hypothetical protein
MSLQNHSISPPFEPLWAAAKEAATRIKTASGGRLLGLFYNNLEVCDIKYFRQPIMREYVKAIEKVEQ